MANRKPKGWRGDSRGHRDAALKGIRNKRSAKQNTPQRKLNKRERMFARITRHGENLKRIFHLPQSTDPIALGKKLRRWENKAGQLTLEHANVGVDDSEYTRREKHILNQVDKILHFRKRKIPVFVNADPRGYALKIEDDYMRSHNIINLDRDWGGYGLIAPDFRDG